MPRPLSHLVKGKYVLVHTGLRGLRDYWETDTESAAMRLLDALISAEPAALFVPTYTYDFTRSGVFDQLESRSEVGAFTEIVRKTCPGSLRTMDPVFSFVDVLNSDLVDKEPNLEAFGPKSIWAQLENVEALIMNIGLQRIVPGPLHYIEYQSRVPYRYMKRFDGSIIDTNRVSQLISYEYYVRRLDEETQWDRHLIESTLEAAGCLTRLTWETVEVLSFSAQCLREVFEPLLAQYPRALLAK